MAQNTQGPGAVSPQLDEMVCDLIGFMLDELAAGCDPGVVACMEDSQGNRSEAAFSDDGEEECLEAARSLVARSAQGVPEDGVGPIACYAIGCVGGVQLEDGFADAVLVSFYEHGLATEVGAPTGFSAYVLYEGFGLGDDFAYADPMPAGEEPPLIEG